MWFTDPHLLSMGERGDVIFICEEVVSFLFLIVYADKIVSGGHFEVL